MIPKLMDRLTRLEAATAPPSQGKHLAFRVEAPRGIPVCEIVTFLRERGHAIHDDDSVLVMNLAAHEHDGLAPLRDLRPDLMTEDDRARAGVAANWPIGAGSSFTFNLDSPGKAR
ncbi:hypothetical protein FV228_01375 [Methylobacterium sp. WL18]|uniref:hypothetical protein n=1 Tax=Methylobacterium sp. WL18 TaxID=2603897 RepID=UPI0011C7DA2D|nr:hypothetical protein [Methylobacterium sp. WL18]TXN76177.1 hypothetical protein FV228_01375 [Methylobacterium sp. WL18]